MREFSEVQLKREQNSNVSPMFQHNLSLPEDSNKSCQNVGEIFCFTFD